MPLPFILGAGAVIAGIAGIGSGINGAVKMKDANDTMKYVQECHQNNIKRFEKTNKQTTKTMDELGNLELKILSSFEKFSNLIEKIHNRPEFAEIKKNNVQIPKYNPEELKKVSIGATALLSGIGGAAAGTAGGFAAAGATTSAVMALGTASTGTAIASLSGAAATNATLAAIGGGAISAGGGGVALGTTILGGATLGVGLLVGGVIFNVTGSKLSDKADEAYSQMKKAENKINTICNYLNDLKKVATDYKKSIENVNEIYEQHLSQLTYLIEDRHKLDWNTYTNREKLLVENTTILVGLLYQMCKVQLVIKSNTEDDINKINTFQIELQKNNAQNLLIENNLVAISY